MVEFDEDFYSSRQVVLETLDDLDDYLTTIDVWIAMSDDSEKDILGDEDFGYYSLHIFDEPIEIVTPYKEVLDTFQGAVVYGSPAKMGKYDISSFTFPTRDKAQEFFEQMRDRYVDYLEAEATKEDEVSI